MIFVTELVIPANTPLLVPHVFTLKMTACTVQHVSVEFPRGCYWLVGTRAIYRTHQLYPTNPDAWIIAEGRTVSWDDNTAIVETPQELILQAYNLDERYSHTLRWFLDVAELSPGGSEPFAPDIYTGYVGF